MKPKDLIVLFQPCLGLYDAIARNIPVGLLSLARMLVKDFEVVIIDQRLPGWSEKLYACMEKNPLCFGVTAQTGEQIINAIEISQWVKRNSKTIVVWGGIHPTLMPEQTIQNEYIDIVLSGEGETSFSELAGCLSSGGNLAEIRGILFKENGITRKTPPRSGTEDLDALPYIPYELIDFSMYSGHAVQNFAKNIFYIETGRGCPYRCDFCYHSGLGNKPRRALSAEGIVSAIKHMKSYTPLDGVTFIDDCFLIDKKRTFEFTRLLRENKLPLIWNCEANVSDVLGMTDTELKELEASGLTWLALGVESGSEKVLRNHGKNLKKDDILAVNSKLSRYAFSVRYNFMCGYIEENNDDLRETTRLIMELLRHNQNASIRGFTACVPFPKTGHFAKAIQHGLREPKRLEEWGMFSSDEWGKRIPWMTGRQRRLRRLLYFASFFIDKKAQINTSHNLIGRLMRIIAYLYRPLAFFRFSSHSVFLPVELWVFSCYRKLLAKRRISGKLKETL